MRRRAALAAAGLALATLVVAPSASAKRVPRAPLASPKTVDGKVADWTGTSPMVAGVSVSSAGEFIHQDYIYDDTGATVGTQTANAGRGIGGRTFGTYRYPTDMPRYLSNAADLFQVRAALVGDRVHLLLWLNSLAAPDTTVVGVAFAKEGSARKAWPLGANLTTPAEHVLTVWGTGGAWDDTPLAEVDGEVAVDVVDNAIEVSLPLELVGSQFKAYVGAGLWSGTGWVSVGGQRSDTTPSGGDGTKPNTFNVAFRTGETIPSPTRSDGNYWFEREQAAALTAGDIDDWFADIDLNAADSPPPNLTGLHQIIHRLSATPAPHEGFIESGVNGNNEDMLNGGRGRGCSLTTVPLVSCTAFSLAGQWQPYAAYVPPGGYDRMEVWLHGGTFPLSYTVVENVQRQLGDDARAVLVEPVALGPASWFTDEAHLDVIEAVRDAQARFGLSGAVTTIGGISMGGYGANRLLVTNPDMFAGGILHSAAVGDPTHEYGGSGYDKVYEPGQGDPVQLLENNRNHRLLMIQGVADQSAHWAFVADQARRLDSFGYEHELLSHLTWTHTTVFDVNDWRREAAFVRGLAPSANPAHVTFSTSEAWWRPDLSTDLVFDRAYWVSGLRVADTAGGFRSKGTVDAVVHGLAGGEEPVTEAIHESVHNGPPAPYARTGRERIATTTLDGPHHFTATLTNLRAITFDVERMQLGDDWWADVTTDAPVTVALGSASVSLPIGEHRIVVGNPTLPIDEEEPPPPERGEPGAVADCGVSTDPGPGSFEAVPPTGSGGTNVTSGDGYARLSSPGTGSYYVVSIDDDSAHAYGRRDGSTVAGEPKYAEAHEIVVGSDPWVCVASPAGGVGLQGP